MTSIKKRPIGGNAKKNAKSSRGGLNARRQRFVEEYLTDLNASRAAIAAGYSQKTARQLASELLTFPNVQAAIVEGRRKMAEATGITQARVLGELELLAFSDVTHYTVDDLGDVTLAPTAPPGAMRAVQSVKRRITTRGLGTEREITREVEIKLWDKPGPLKLAGQHVGLFADRRELTGKDGAPLPPMVFTVKLADQREDD